MSNPAFNRMPAFDPKNQQTLSADQLREIYNQPAATAAARTAHQGAQPGFALGGSATPMTYENTITKTVMLFLVLLTTAAVGWMFPMLAIPGAIAGLVLGLVNAFKREPSIPLIVLYAAAEGLFVGGISQIFEARWSGIVFQAVLGTVIVFGVTLLLFRSGKVRTSPRANKIFLIATVGYLAFSVVNLVLMWTGVATDPWGLRGVQLFGIPLGVIIGALAILLAAYSLVQDFDVIKGGVENRIDQKYGWSAAFGLMVTLVWLYVEILRLLAILRGND